MDRTIKLFMQPNEDEKPTYLTRRQLSFEQGTAFGLSITINGPAGTSVAIRGMTKEGPFNLSYPVISPGVSQSKIFRIPDMPIMVSVVDELGTLLQGQLFAELSLTINGTKSYSFCSGYIYKGKGISYPATSSGDVRPGGGSIGAIQIANPGVGLNVDYTLPVGFLYRIISVRATLATDANAGNRQITFFSIFNALEHSYCWPDVLQPASTTKNYHGSSLATKAVEIGGRIVFQIPQEWWIRGGGKLKTITMGLFGGDQFSNIEILVEIFTEA